MKDESMISIRQRIRTVGLRAWERMDTLKSAGLCDDGMMPMRSGFKTNVGLLVAAFMFKWYRARFINKVSVCPSRQYFTLTLSLLSLSNCVLVPAFWAADSSVGPSTSMVGS